MIFSKFIMFSFQRCPLQTRHKKNLIQMQIIPSTSFQIVSILVELQLVFAVIIFILFYIVLAFKIFIASVSV